jgi:hypothetical protein
LLTAVGATAAGDKIQVCQQFETTYHCAVASDSPFNMATNFAVLVVVTRLAFKASATKSEIMADCERDSFNASSWICCPWYSGKRSLMLHSFRMVLSHFSSLERGRHIKRLRR